MRVLEPRRRVAASELGDRSRSHEDT
jgi:hypothetical protein